jgi:hypothetical protein
VPCRLQSSAVSLLLHDADVSTTRREPFEFR